jgi:hypothetical protein
MHADRIDRAPDSVRPHDETRAGNDYIFSDARIPLQGFILMSDAVLHGFV